MRCGEIALSLLTDEDYAERAEEEILLGLDWGEKGGLVSYTWHWYSPDNSRGVLTSETRFDLAAALDGQDTEQLASQGADEIEALYASGYVSDEMYAIIQDIDLIAAQLKRFADADIPVIWQPLPDGDSSLYWWGGDSDSYKKLWQFMFDRFNNVYGLGNLIWVWNGSDAEFYPGDKYCDIIGQTIYENSSSAFGGRFAALSEMSGEEVKMLAITDCDKLPKPEYMLRENAMWLWFAIGSGDSIIDSEGELSETHTNWQSLNDAYNCDICTTLDELPDFSTYAIR
jgi:mannan endo-1,4-beta-mannosidase